MIRLVLPLALAALVGGCGPTTSGLVDSTPDAHGLAVGGPQTSAVSVVSTSAPPAVAKSNAVPAPELRVAIPTAKPPPDLPVPAAEVVRLSQHVLGESVLVDYINSIQEPYTLNADQVIYLSDLGMQPAVIQALIKRSAVIAPVRKTTTEVVAVQSGQLGIPTGSAASTNEPAATNAILTNYLVSTNAGYPTGIPYANAPSAQPAPGVPAVQPPLQPVASMVQPTPVDDTQIYTALSPYGSWVDDPDYGWSWQPTVAVVDTGWRPYLQSGNWVWTDAGWYWNSSYSWGWLPFHYGRWTLATSRGWIWVPDNVWGPAWVTWRSSDTLCGWAPLPPGAYWRHGEGLYYHGRHVTVGFDFGLGEGWYCAVPYGHFCDPWVYHHCVSGPTFSVFFGGSRIVNDYRHDGGGERGHFVNHGPGVAPVEKATRGEVVKYNIHDLPRPGGVTPLPGRVGESSGGHSVSAFRGNLTPVTSRPPSTVLASQNERQVHDTPYTASLAARPAVPARISVPSPANERGGGAASIRGIAGATGISPGAMNDGASRPVAAQRPSGTGANSTGTLPPSQRPTFQATTAPNPSLGGQGERPVAQPSVAAHPTTTVPSIRPALASSSPGTAGPVARPQPTAQSGNGGFGLPAHTGRSEPAAAVSNPDVFAHSEATWARSSTTPRPLSNTELNSAGFAPAGGVAARPSPAATYPQAGQYQQYAAPQPARAYSAPQPTYSSPQYSAPVQRQYSAPAPQPHYSAPAPAPAHSGGGAAPVSRPANGNRHGN